MKVFGKRESGKKYIKRNAVYGVCIVDEEVVTVKVRDSLFLPGGGLETNETEQDSLIREFQEELGWNIKILSNLGSAQQFFRSYAGDNHYLSTGTFFLVEKVDCCASKIDLDHELFFLPINSLGNLQFEYFKWACEIGAQYYI